MFCLILLKTHDGYGVINDIYNFLECVKEIQGVI